jgi:hypothetical protein
MITCSALRRSAIISTHETDRRREHKSQASSKEMRDHLPRAFLDVNSALRAHVRFVCSL